MKLGEIAYLAKDKINSSSITLEEYVTTDSLLQDKKGRTIASNLPPNDCSLTRFEKDDILVANIRPYLKKVWKADITGGASNDVLVFRAGQGVPANFLYAVLLQDAFYDHVMLAPIGAKMPRGEKNHILRYEILCLTNKSQEFIGTLISAIDRKIALNRKANELLESMAKQLYDYWFVQFDFPNAEGKPYKSSGGKMVYNETLKRDIPERWEVGNLFEVSNLLTGGTPSKAVDDYWQSGTIPFFGPTDCDGSTFQFTTEYRITEAGVSHSAAKVMNENCVIITARGSIGKYVITGIPMAMNQSCFAFEAKDGNYAHLYFLVGQLIQHLLVKGSGSTFKSIVGIDIENSILCLGEPNVRKVFEQIVRPMFEKIKSNTQETLRLTSLRDYLLPLLMNGQVKVS